MTGLRLHHPALPRKCHRLPCRPLGRHTTPPDCQQRTVPALSFGLTRACRRYVKLEDAAPETRSNRPPAYLVQPSAHPSSVPLFPTLSCESIHIIHALPILFFYSCAALPLSRLLCGACSVYTGRVCPMESDSRLRFSHERYNSHDNVSSATRPRRLACGVAERAGVSHRPPFQPGEAV